MEFRGMRICITGAASGIGRATAVRLALLGGRLFLTDINAAGLEETRRMIESHGGEVCLSRAFDIGDYPQVQAFADDVHARYGPLDILINVAGIALFSQIEYMRHGDWEKIIRVNLWGPIHGIECFVPEMIRGGKPGHVVSISSTAGIIGLPWHAAYAATKHALVGISEVLRYDLRKHRIGVSVVCPGAVDTGLVNTADIRASQAATQKGRNLFRKVAIPPEKVADLICGAIAKNRFLVITSVDIKLLFLLKRWLPFAYDIVMRILCRLMDHTLMAGRDRGAGGAQ
ncbi:MAG TPA: SDR family oxidoreductase [Syntrophorhabdaceae bacterium]|nr:SDR family oxidoreductase [Syntrophorhabdaceae bacterium]HPA07248.1 SDR family oxidoreductase [Methanoregulaceae archaeon]